MIAGRASNPTRNLVHGFPTRILHVSIPRWPDFTHLGDLGPEPEQYGDVEARPVLPEVDGETAELDKLHHQKQRPLCAQYGGGHITGGGRRGSHRGEEMSRRALCSRR